MKAEFDLTKTVEEISMQAKETQEDFIFETLHPYCEHILQIKINKEELKQILLNGAKKQQPCDDCISREEVINVVHKYFVKYLKLNDDICLDGIRSLSPVTPQQKIGHWIDTGSGQMCSKCGEIQYGYDNFRQFCASCGAKMIESEE